jgi:cytoplasmic iron level regulating protein YaaA (DUF328/UPF0246 family)
MLMVISPAKTLDYETPPVTPSFTQPAHLAESKRLISRLRKLGPGDIAQLMSLSDKLAALNVARYGEWKPPFTPANAKQAVLAFNGDVYDGLAAGDFSEEDFAFAQAHLRILSGLYGVLRPLDLMQPYRLEMGTRLANERGDNLYDFWGQRVTKTLKAVLAEQDSSVLVNLASEEYFGVVQSKALKARVITPVFEDWNANSAGYKIISFHAKKARGMMARHAIRERVTEVESLKSFDSAGYAFYASASTPDRWVFRRKAA